MSDLTERLRSGFGGMVPPVCDEAATRIESDKATIERLNGSLSRLQKFIDLQAEDEGLWCISEHASEAYIQRGLRGCHAMIEQELEALADEK